MVVPQQMLLWFMATQGQIEWHTWNPHKSLPINV